MQRNPLLIAFAVFYVLLAVLTWSQDVTRTPDGRTVLTFWHTYGDEETAMLKEIIAEWEKLPANAAWTIRPIRLPFDGHKPKIRTALTVGLGPDMARVDWSFVCELARRNACVDLGTLGFDKIKDQYVTGPLQTNFIDGKYQGIPEQTNCVALFYNKTMFRDAGLDPDQPPKTWDEFIEMGKKLTNAEKGIYAFGMDNTVWWSLPFFNGFGARLISEDGKKCLLASPEAVKAMELKASLFATHKIEAGAWRAGGTPPEQGFQNQKYAMIFTGPWNLPRFSASKLEFGIGLIPAGPNGTSSNVGGNNAVIFKAGKHHQACYDFLTYFTSAPVQAKWCMKLNQIPVNKGAYDLVQFEDKNLNVFLEQMKSTLGNPVVTSFEMLENVVNPEMETVLTGQKTAADAMRDAVRKVEEKVLTL
ncbi:MAG: extracellular solute-binding protein [Candidatus Riflebacteria bacterium]|nr:extracellular solute-binding protein [Candidatus Riflebacteria bacterium]